jgi:hypothetical protein
MQEHQQPAFREGPIEYPEYRQSQPEFQMRSGEPIQFFQSQRHPQAVQFVSVPQEMYYSNREGRVQERRFRDVYNNQAVRNYEYPHQEDFVNRVQQNWVQQVGIEGRVTNRNNLKEPLRNEQGTEGVEKQDNSRKEEALKAQVKEMLLKAKHEDRLEVEKEDKRRQEKKEKQRREKENENNIKKEKENKEK